VGVAIPELATGSGIGARIQEWLGRLRTGVESPLELELRHANGSRVRARLSAKAMVGKSGEYEGAVAIVAAVFESSESDQSVSLSGETPQGIGAQLHSVADKPALFSYVGADEHYRFVSERFEHYFDRRLDAIEGKPVREVLGDDSYEKVRRHMEAALAGERVTYGTWMRFPRAGTRFVKWLYVPERGEDGRVKGFFSLASDVTELKELEEAIGAERNILNTILDTTGALILMLDPDARIVRFNRACERATGYRSEEVEGKPVWILLDPSQKKTVREVFRSLATGEDVSNRFENDWVAKDGTNRRITWSNTVLRNTEGNVHPCRQQSRGN